MKRKLLSKTNYLNGLQCPKYLWTISHEREKIPRPDKATQYVFDQGHFVGELAKRLFPTGIDVPTSDFMDNIRQTRALAEKRLPLFEPGILAGNLYSRIDILEPAGDDRWNLIEVKSTTSVKEVHIHDVSFQRYCCEQAGLEIDKSFLIYINNQYVKSGDISPEELFTMQDITAEVYEAGREIQSRIEGLLEVMESTRCPDVTIGRHCLEPYDCPIKECWSVLPEHHVFTLYRGGQKSYDLFEKGIFSIGEIPIGHPLTANQEIQRKCVTSDQVHVDRAGISDFLSWLEYPLSFLDFETFSPAVPRFDGTRPYQAIPFQFSLHVVRDGATQPEHYSFLAKDTADPRPDFLSSLQRSIPTSGSVVAYNKSFEEGVLKTLAEAFPEHREWIGRILPKTVDLLVPFRKFQYYHPSQKGSASIKQVLPAVTGVSYDSMAIPNGEEASIAFQTATYGSADEAIRTKVYEELESYCGLDTEGMIWIIEKLKRLSS